MIVFAAVALILALAVTAWRLNRERRSAEWDGFGRGLATMRYQPDEGWADVIGGWD